MVKRIRENGMDIRDIDGRAMDIRGVCGDSIFEGETQYPVWPQNISRRLSDSFEGTGHNRAQGGGISGRQTCRAG